MGVTLRQVPPKEIESESFKIIADELGNHSFDQQTLPIVQRVIHATGDFSFAENLRFSPGAVEKAIAYLRRGKSILTDVTMVAAGISKPLLARFGGQVLCGVADPEIAEIASKENRTRSEVAIENLLTEDIGIIAVGNAPTALVHAIREVNKLNSDKRPVIIGVPVGFVNAAESKDLLVEQNDCYITSLGRKGGSPVAASIVNALLRLATAQ